MLKRSLRIAATRVAPRAVRRAYLHLKIVRAARALSALRRSKSEDFWHEALWRSHFFRPLQRQNEILRLLDMLKRRRPGTICEIGAAGGGTTFLLADAARPDATIISIDLNFTAAREAALRQFAFPQQKMICLHADSHRRETVRAVSAALRGQSLDILYLDGDHSFHGVATDFALFSPLVRPGGLVIFHDIVPDYRSRYGIETKSNVGGVPEFWREIKMMHAHTEEIVENYDQDGFGIGILRWGGADAGPSVCENKI